LLLCSTLAVAAATFAIPFLGALSSVFSFVPLSAIEISAVVAIVLGYIVATEVGKIWFFWSINTAGLPKPIRARKTKASEPRPHPLGPFMNALVATGLVVGGALVLMATLILIGTLVQLSLQPHEALKSVFWPSK
jgi:Mg2+-importing ATPase